ncbi:MAG: hypothetical protein OEV44_07285 [Spirochaetota bacterium]|nr:hypothetical protein [Spirochaetota bacterium]
MENHEKEIKKYNDKNWVVFLSDMEKPDKIAVIIGFIFILSISIGIVYIAKWQAAYANQFYNVKFKISFLQGIKSGLKIRYQGGAIVGEVVMVESNYSEHYLHAKIMKSFKIIKFGTEVTLQSQGSFGSTYLNISTIQNYFSGEAYTNDDIIQVSEIIPFQGMINNLDNLFKSTKNQDSIMVTKLNNVKGMVYQISSNTYFIPSVIRLIFKGVTQKIQEGFSNFQQMNDKLFQSVDKINFTLNNIASSLRQKLPIIRNSTQKIYRIVQYNPQNPENARFIHDEQLYYSILIRLNIIKQRLAMYKESPYKMIFKSGL